MAASAWAQDPALDVPADTAQGIGHLNLILPPGQALLIVNGDYDGFRSIGRNDTIAFPVGQHRITIANSRTGDIEFDARIQEGRVLTERVAYSAVMDRPEGYPPVYYELSSFPAIVSRTNLVVQTDGDSEVFIDGRSYGFGEVRLDTLEGAYTVTTDHPLAGHSERIVDVRTDPLRMVVVEMYNKPERGKVRGFSVVPGLSQFYQREPLKGAALAALFGAGVGASIIQHSAFVSSRADYEDLRGAYSVAQDEQEALELGDRAEAEHRKMEQRFSLRNMALGLAAAVYLANVIDVWMPPSSGYREAQEPPFRLEPEVGFKSAGIRLFF